MNGPYFADIDWHNSDGYAALRAMDRGGLAWEWLRRNANYRQRVSNSVDDAMLEHSGAALTVVAALSARDASETGVHFR